MNDTTPAAPDAAVVEPLAPGPLRRVVGVLCVTQVVAWGVLFYSLPVLATGIAGAEGWALTHLMAVFTLAQLVAAAAGVWVGRHLDVVGPRRVMTAGSALGVLAVVAVAAAPSLPLYLVAWLLAGLAMSATLYPPAFATVTHWAGAGRVRALTAITLVAGLASTVFAPLAAVLEGQLGWRGTYLVLAAVLATTVPLHWWGLRDPWRTVVAADPAPGAEAGSPAGAVVAPPRELALLVAALTLAGFCVFAVVVNLVPFLTEQGLTTTQAAVALGIGGVGQVAGRLLYAPLLAPTTVQRRTVVVLVAAGTTTLAVALLSGSVLMACVTSFAAGLARGVFTLVQATAVSDRWGTHSYGARTAVLSAGVAGAVAFAPWAGAALAGALGSYPAAFVALALVGAGSALLVRPTAISPRGRPSAGAAPSAPPAPQPRR